MPYFLAVLTGFHMLFAAVFVGSNVFLDFILTRRMELIPPGQAARLGEKVGVDFALLNWLSLLGLVGTGIGLILELKIDTQLQTSRFYSSGYGVALMTMIVIGVLLIISASVLTFYLRPRVVVKLPYDASREDVKGGRDSALQAARWMKVLARVNAIASMAAMLVGGFLQYGGFFS